MLGGKTDASTTAISLSFSQARKAVADGASVEASCDPIQVGCSGYSGWRLESSSLEDHVNLWSKV